MTNKEPKVTIVDWLIFGMGMLGGAMCLGGLLNAPGWAVSIIGGVFIISTVSNYFKK